MNQTDQKNKDKKEQSDIIYKMVEDLTEEKRFWLTVDVGTAYIDENFQHETEAFRKHLKYENKRFWKWFQINWRNHDLHAMHLIEKNPDVDFLYLDEYKDFQVRSFQKRHLDKYLITKPNKKNSNE